MPAIAAVLADARWWLTSHRRAVVAVAVMVAVASIVAVGVATTGGGDAGLVPTTTAPTKTTPTIPRAQAAVDTVLRDLHVEDNGAATLDAIHRAVAANLGDSLDAAPSVTDPGAFPPGVPVPAPAEAPAGSLADATDADGDGFDDDNRVTVIVDGDAHCIDLVALEATAGACS